MTHTLYWEVRTKRFFCWMSCLLLPKSNFYLAALWHLHSGFLWKSDTGKLSENTTIPKPWQLWHKMFVFMKLLTFEVVSYIVMLNTQTQFGWLYSLSTRLSLIFTLVLGHLTLLLHAENQYFVNPVMSLMLHNGRVQCLWGLGRRARKKIS